MKLSSYVVTHDYGFAPNPYGGFLTLATCKPNIRRGAEVGDWIMGTGSKNGIGSDRLIFVGHTSEVVTLEKYGNSTDFDVKFPLLDGQCEAWRRRGDNIYYKSIEDNWVQRVNPFHDDSEIQNDTNGLNVIVCQQFWYFGSNAPVIPERYNSLVKKGPNHKNNIGNSFVPGFLEWVKTFNEGIHGKPSSLYPFNYKTR